MYGRFSSQSVKLFKIRLTPKSQTPLIVMQIIVGLDNFTYAYIVFYYYYHFSINSVDVISFFKHWDI